MVLLVFVTGEAGVPGSDLPRVVRVTDHAIGFGVFPLLMLSSKSVMTGCAASDWPDLLFLEMAHAAAR